MVDRKPARRFDEDLRISRVTKKVAEEILRRRIESHRRRLLAILDQDGTSYIVAEGQWNRGHRIHGDDAYKVTLGIMREFGYDEKVFNSPSEVITDSTTVRTITVYPSKTKEGLSFTKFEDRPVGKTNITSTTFLVDSGIAAMPQAKRIPKVA